MKIKFFCLLRKHYFYIMDNKSNLTFDKLTSACQEQTDKLKTRFLHAVTILNFDIIKQCLDYGVNPNCHHGDYVTPLHLAAEKGSLKLAQLLLTYQQTNPDLTNIEGLTSLNLASRYGFKDVVNILLENHADFNRSDKMEFTPLHSAVLQGHEEIVVLLLEYGANPNLLNSFGFSPLFLAANEYPNKVIVENLFKYQADANLYQPNFTLPLLMECCLSCNSTEQIEMIELLIKNGANINEVYPITKRTALHIAAFTGYLALIKVLLNYGARLDLKDVGGKIPYQIAQEQKNKSAEYILNPNKIVMFKLNMSK